MKDENREREIKMMNIKSMYGTKLTELLKNYQAKNELLAKNGFLVFEELKANAMLFLGINPSNVENIEKNYSVKKESGIYWAKEAFKNEYPYYKPFDNLANGMKWSHLDIYFSCEKKLENLKELENSDFLKEQFNISKIIIQKLAPKMIVVVNAYASHIIQEDKDFGCEFDDEIGTYRTRKYNNIPIFFSGMITGQRALDIFSRERLKWHIGFVQKKNNIHKIPVFKERQPL
jgi:hypothetical protein